VQGHPPSALWLDPLDAIKTIEQVHRAGGGNYQTLINAALRDYIHREPLEETVRRVLREELQEVGGS
jgi:hypothetical protein